MCVLVIDIPSISIHTELPLPLTILKFVAFQKLPKEDFLKQWEKCCHSYWHGGRRLVSNRQVTSAT